MFVFYLNSNVINAEPIGWDKFSVEIEKNVDLRHYRILYTGDLIFIGDAYQAIKEAIVNNGRDQIMTFSVYNVSENGESTLFTDGTINLTEGKDIVWQSAWSTPIRDNNYSSKLFNNSELKVWISYQNSLSKNGVTISSPTVRNFGGNSSYDDRNSDRIHYKGGYELKDCFEFMISYLSDNTLAFESSWLDNLGYEILLFTVDGAYIDANRGVTTTLSEMVRSFGRLYNLYLTVEGSTVRLEEEAYFLGADSSINITESPRYEVTFDEKSVFSEIKVGDKISGDNPSVYPNNNINYQPIECYMNSNAPSSGKLDLQPDYIINTGVVQTIRNNSFTGIGKAVLEELSAYHEREIQEEFYKSYTPSNWYDTTLRDQVFVLTPGDILSGGTTNNELTNANVLARYNFIKDVYYQSNGTSSFRFEFSDKCMFPILADGTDQQVKFWNLQNEGAFKLTGGENNSTINQTYSHSGSTETKKFAITVKLPKYYNADDAGLKRQQQISDMIFISEGKQYELPIIHVISGSETFLVFDKPSYWEVGDRVYFKATNDSSNGWSTNGTGNYTVTSTIEDGLAVKISLDSSSITAEFPGGKCMFRHPNDSGGYSLTEYRKFEKKNWNAEMHFRLGIKRTESLANGAGVLDNEYIEYTSSVYSDNSYTFIAEIECESGNRVYPYIRISKNGSATDKYVVVTPIEWTDLESSPRKAANRSTDSFFGDLVEFEIPLDDSDVESLIRYPYKAITMPEGKGWIKNAAVNIQTKLAKFTLQTNSSYFNAGT